ncbi:MAG TPA: DUF6084 family protein [Verrucomicrobiaceae bacterium]|jgi:hypothetical protein
MPDLDFKVDGAEPAHHGMTPLLRFRLTVSNQPANEVIEGIALHAQIQIECPKRNYDAREKRRLFDLFGKPERWGDTVRNRLWAQVDTSVRGFSGRIETTIHVPCTYDLNIASARYLDALDDGEAPLLFLFSGTVFYRDQNGLLQTQRVPWEKECCYRMARRAWREMIDYHYPNSAWLFLDRDVFERLAEYRRQNGFTTWERTFAELLPSIREEVMG